MTPTELKQLGEKVRKWKYWNGFPKDSRHQEIMAMAGKALLPLVERWARLVAHKHQVQDGEYEPYCALCDAPLVNGKMVHSDICIVPQAIAILSSLSQVSETKKEG